MTGNAIRLFLIAGSAGGFGWPGSSLIETALVADGYLDENGNSGEEDDFDALLGASSFGSEQAREIREQTPHAAREHARRVLDGKEKYAPADGDVDDAVSGLVYGLAHEVVPGPALLILACSALTPEDLVTALPGYGQADLRLVIFTACQTSALWPDHRARLLQSLIDHDAFASLRLDVAWKIIDWTFDVPRPPRVLRQCAALAVEQIDFSAVAYTWLPSTWGDAMAVPDVRLQQETPPENAGSPVPPAPALACALPPAALTAGPARPAIGAKSSTSAKARHRPRRVRAHTHGLPGRRRASRRKPSTVAARKDRRPPTPPARKLVAAAAAFVAVVIGLLLGILHAGVASGMHSRLAADPVGWQAESRASVASAVFFHPDSATLMPGAVTVLRAITLQAQSRHLAVSITGYASPGGTDAYHLTLSVRRAEVVRDWLTTHGVPAAHITRVSGAGPYTNVWCQGRPVEAACPELSRTVIVLSPTENP